ncbi:MAG TPA: aldo/keto reductase [Spirochaetia bacterium]|nr:aldo/keto reductase [Spirochaetia bacterium]
MVRKLGRSGISISALGMGCWAIGGPFWRGNNSIGWGKIDDQESVRAVHKALDLGITYFDTADVYGAGHSERVLGEALAGRRSEVVISTKFGLTFNEETRQAGEQDGSVEYVRVACQASLRRLNTDYIDLYFLHIGDLDPDRAVSLRDALEEMVKRGLIRSYGWSTDLEDRARLFAEGKGCTAIQSQMNVIEDAPRIVAVCERFNLAQVVRGPLAMGLLTGKYRSGSSIPSDDVRGDKGPSWMKYFRGGKPAEEWLKKVEAVREILTSKGRTQAQGALAWLWARSPNTIPIPGFKTADQVAENASAMKHGPLTAEQLAEIDRILER